MYKYVWTGLAMAGFAVFTLNCAPKPTEKELSGKIRGKTSLRLADGSPISTDAADEYNPYIVKLSDDYLVLIFGSNRVCGTCSGHNIFIAKSVSPYSGLTLPFFNTPVALTDGGSPLNLPDTINFAAVASTTSVVLYVNDNAGDIQKGTVSNPNTPTASFTTIGNTAILSNKVIGISSSGGDLVTTDSGGTSYTANPNITESPTPYGFGLDSALSATQVRLDNTGYDDSYMAVASSFGPFATPIATTKAFPFGPIINFDLALLSSGLSITHINTLYGDTAENDIILFSARDEVSADLYVVTSHTSKALWEEVASFGGDTMGPPPPDHWFGFDGMSCPGSIFDMGFTGGWMGSCIGSLTITSPSYNFTDYADPSAGGMDLSAVPFDPYSAGFTIAAWVRVNALCSGNCTIVANKDSGTGTGFKFYLDGSLNKLSFLSRNGATTIAASAGSEIAKDGITWYHVAVVANAGLGYAYLYVDGSYVGASSSAQTFFPTNVNAYMGQTSDGAEYFNGAIDDLMIFEYELYDDEIAMLAFGF